MWTEVGKGWAALLNYSPTALFIGSLIFLLSGIDAVLTKKSGRERAFSIIVVCLSVLLLLVQARSGELADAKSASKLHEALQNQRDELTRAFNAGTEAIERQAARQFSQVQGAAMGTTTCPTVLASITRPSGRPHSLVIFNPDKKLNMYDLKMELIEWGPGEPGGPWSTILQQRLISVPIIVPDRATPAPFEFLSKMNDIDVQISLTTRTTTCWGRIGVFDTGHNVWVNDHSTMAQQGGNIVYDKDMKLSPGLAHSQPDPESQ